MLPNSEPKLANYDSALTKWLVEGDPAAVSCGRRSRRKALGMSFAIETALLGLLLVAPLLTSVAQPQFHHISLPMPIILSVWHPHNTDRTKVANPIHSQVTPVSWDFGPHLPDSAADIHKTMEPDNSPVSDPIGQYIPGAIPITDLGERGAAPPPPPPYIEQKKPDEKRKVKVSEGVQQAQLISRIDPRYPFIAIQTRTEGTVRLRAIISRDGRISALEVLSGPPLLVRAALDAVGQ